MENLAEWGYFGLFVASFLAATIIPFSSEIVLSILIAKNYDLSTSLFVASIGNWVGGLSSYLIGRIGSWNTIEKYLKVKRKNILLWKKKIDSWGGILAFLCWLPVIGDPIAIALGWGLAFGAIVITLIFPCLIAISDDIRNIKNLFRRKKA